MARFETVWCLVSLFNHFQQIRPGERRWYALKDKKLLGRAKGNNPQVMLEMDLVWNPVRTLVLNSDDMIIPLFSERECFFALQVAKQRVCLKSEGIALYGVL